MKMKHVNYTKLLTCFLLTTLLSGCAHSTPLPHQSFERIEIKAPDPKTSTDTGPSRTESGALGMGYLYPLLMTRVANTVPEAIAKHSAIFWKAPEGTKVLIAGYSYSTGNLFLGNSIPIGAADSTVYIAEFKPPSLAYLT
jgi:hypothetical protein